MFENFTPVSALLGGALMGLSALGLLAYNRQICGVSGMIEGCLPPVSDDSDWRASFLLGLVIGGLMLSVHYPEAFDFNIPSALWTIFLGGFFVGIGSRLSHGCTSGHGICGIGRLSRNSIVITLLFLITAIVTATTIGYF
jgi:hypothetical protein